ncbi:unnamed protein product [Mesocestoides corti]|uniref:Uncharacterized protein n=2 Tax=Mesocestoides corti TaxID=53468 RepID=A0A0R3UP14_MESCO|nr:unnamed protein product [Mesocestoides corti]
MGQPSTKLQQIHNSAIDESALVNCQRWCTPRSSDNVVKDEEAAECDLLPPLLPEQPTPPPPPTSAEPCAAAVLAETQRGDVDEAPQVTGPTKPMFFINCYNGAHLVLPVLGRLEWSRVYDRREIPNCCFRWTETVLQLNYQIFKECEQMVNHIPNCGHLTNKLGLLLSVRDYAAKRRLTARRDSSLNFLPETYWIDDPKEKQTFIHKLCNEQLWIFKPCGLNQGKGISLIRSHLDFDRIEEARMEEIRRNPRMCRPRIVQKYLVNPLVLNDRKFDIRCYLMIVSTMPYLVLFSPGYVRLSLRKYNPYDTDLVTHLTNQFVQKKDPHYKKLKEDTVWTFNRLNEYINTYVAPVRRLQRNWVTRQLLPEMHRISTHVFSAVKDKLACRVGFFEIYGMDFMIDSSLKVWLIEINSNPAMNTNCEALKQVIPPIVNKFIQISIECFEKARRWQPLLPILGIRPRDPPDPADSPGCDSWCVKLRSSPRSLINNGLPANFTVLYHESLTTARARQTKSYKIPLRLWVPPKMYIPVPPPKHGLVVTTSPSLAELAVATAGIGSKKPSPRLNPSPQRQFSPIYTLIRSPSSPANSPHYSKPPTPGLRETPVISKPSVQTTERNLSVSFKQNATETPAKKSRGDRGEDAESAEFDTGIVLTPDALAQLPNDATNEEQENSTTDNISNSIGPDM